MAQADQIRWNRRYSEGIHNFERPDPVVEKILSLVPETGYAVDVACGLGRHALWMAQHGWEVDAIDLSDIAIHQFQENMKKHPHLIEKVHLDHRDLDNWTPNVNQYHLGLMAYFWDEKVLEKLRHAIIPGGTVIVCALLRPLTLSGPSFHYPDPGLLAQRFSSWTVWWNREDFHTGVTSIAARKPLFP